MTGRWPQKASAEWARPLKGSLQTASVQIRNLPNGSGNGSGIGGSS
jgi:hypothetical protein